MHSGNCCLLVAQLAATSPLPPGRDRRKIGKEVAEATRKSVRIRAVPEVFAPPAVPVEARGRGKRPPPRPEDATDVNLGHEFQAELPAVRPRPAAPTAEEQRFVSRLVCAAGDVAPLQYDVQQTAALPAASRADRWVLGRHLLWSVSNSEQLNLPTTSKLAVSGMRLCVPRPPPPLSTPSPHFPLRNACWPSP